MKNKTKFFLGLGITLLISFLYFLFFFLQNHNTPFFEIRSFPFTLNFCLPIFIYAFISLWCKIEANILSKKISCIAKYFFAIFFIIATFFISEWDNMMTYIPLIVSISILSNWNTKEEKTIKEPEEAKSHSIAPYLINFITLFFVYLIVSMCYSCMESENNVLITIFLFGIDFIISFWLGYWCYGKFLKNTKISRIFQIVISVVLMYWIYFFGSTIGIVPIHLLIAFELIAFLSLTVQNLIANFQKKGNPRI